MDLNIEEKLINVKGIGPKSNDALKKMGIDNVFDLISYFPKDYKEYKEPVPYDKLQENYFMTVCGTFLLKPFLKHTKNMDIVTAKMQIDGGVVDLIWFRLGYLSKTLFVNETYYIYGRIKKKNNRYVIEQGEVYTREKYLDKLNSLTPIYKTKEGITNNFLEKYTKKFVSEISSNNIANTNKYINIFGEDKNFSKNIYKSIHFPKDITDYESARKYFVYKEFFDFIFTLKLSQKDEVKKTNALKKELNLSIVKTVLDSLNFSLTNDQKRVLNNMISDMKSDYASKTILQGDVGCGKTIIAFLLMLIVATNGYQGVLMAPTEVLAIQHYKKLVSLINKTNMDYEVVLLTGSIKGKGKKEITQKINSGQVKLIIGTHALIQEKMTYKNIALVITDEQHKFGVNQREKLYTKGESPHYLVMSATPIPRTLALILYGNAKIEQIKEMPLSRKQIKNALVNVDDRMKIYRFIKKEIENFHHQAYIICPLIDDNENKSGENVKDYSRNLQKIFEGITKVGILHGKMTPIEKNEILSKFEKNEIGILVSTTVIEVGIDVPNATVMVIENADTFGLASLHQLRGRIGRGDSQGYCVFVNGSKDESKKKRLEVLEKTNDGFEIAKEDLKLRGPGELLGLRQAGEIKFKYADIYQDSNILFDVNKCVSKIIADDPTLSSDKNTFLKDYLNSVNYSF